MTSLNRRTWAVTAAAGLAALGAGAWCSARNAPGQASPPGAKATGPLPASGSLVTLDGRTLTAADAAGRIVVLNFWAPWCPPCVREMPDLDRFAHSPAGKGALVIGLAIDERPAVDKFVQAHPVGFPISVLGYEGLGWAKQLGNDAGSLPFSVVFDRQGRLVQRKMGPTTVAELSAWTHGI